MSGMWPQPQVGENFLSDKNSLLGESRIIETGASCREEDFVELGTCGCKAKPPPEPSSAREGVKVLGAPSIVPDVDSGLCLPAPVSSLHLLHMAASEPLIPRGVNSLEADNIVEA